MSDEFGIVVDGLYVPEHGLHGYRNFKWGTVRVADQSVPGRSDGGANPETCLHRVIHQWASDCGDVILSCVSCQTIVGTDHWEGKLFKFNPDFDHWIQVGPSDSGGEY